METQDRNMRGLILMGTRFADGGDGSGTERLELVLSDGRGCIEFIRILLGLALAEGIDLGQNPDVELRREERSCIISKWSPPPKTSQTHGYRNNHATVSSSNPPSIPASLSVEPSSEGAVLSSGQASYTSDASVPSHSRSSAGVSSSSKRKYSEVDDGADGADDQPNLPKKVKKCGANRVYPYQSVWSRMHRDIVHCRFYSRTGYCSILRGRSRRRQQALGLEDILAGSTAGGGAGRCIGTIKGETAASQPDCSDCRTSKQVRRTMIAPLLEQFRAFLGDQLHGFLVENRVLSVSLSELKRPVKYFWGVHDFVRGLRGAILAHAHVTSRKDMNILLKSGILHRDISENNVVLARRPGEERGYLIDFDMAILPEPEEPATEIVTTEDGDPADIDAVLRASSPIQPDGSEPLKALRTGTTPYMSFNVLFGRKHTYFDDMESFLYVLLLFFFSYAGPLPKDELRAADSRGFVQVLGSGRLSHITKWPDTYAMWAGGAFAVIADRKNSALTSTDSPKELIRSAEVRNCLKDNWDTGLHRSIQVILLWSWKLFAESRSATLLLARRTQVKHREFVGVLDKWLEMFSGDEEKFSNCPFK
ncbi:hypothetical protein BU15DRAFT_61607 [Melanogaster broomeanus]|nr:hypothetical protein BU15DRAFT_61607 [Melanogaster broomeanus]